MITQIDDKTNYTKTKEDQLK